MKYYSTRGNKNKTVPLSYAVLKGLADDGGLYLPEQIPRLEASFIERLDKYTLPEIGFTVAKAFTGNEVPDDRLKYIVDDALNFPVPLIHISDNMHVMELFHGPTMAFKDVGARFMARLMAYFAASADKEIKIIAATSGDTGSAVAAGFYNVKGISVYILYPQGKVSPLQEKQLTTWGRNISAIEVQGSFDDCQRLAKQLLADDILNKRFLLTSANSINIARLIPQSFYYFQAYARLRKTGKPLVISVPSGNFGNLTGGLLASHMGLPVKRFIASTNSNAIVPQFLQSGRYIVRPSIPTISNAMDVGNPSNFERLENIFLNKRDNFTKVISGYAFTDAETEAGMKKIFSENGYMLDPHGAIAYLGLQRFIHESNEDIAGVFLETAHPAKFAASVNRILGTEVAIPERLLAFDRKQKQTTACKNDFESVKKLLIV